MQRLLQYISTRKFALKVNLHVRRDIYILVGSYISA